MKICNCNFDFVCSSGLMMTILLFEKCSHILWYNITQLVVCGINNYFISDNMHYRHVYTYIYIYMFWLSQTKFSSEPLKRNIQRKFNTWHTEVLKSQCVYRTCNKIYVDCFLRIIGSYELSVVTNRNVASVWTLKWLCICRHFFVNTHYKVFF